MSDSSFPLSPAAQSAPQARGRLRELMGDWGDEGIRDDALLLLTEIVANGVRHAGSAMRVRLSLSRELLRAEVSDDNPLAPRRRVPDESGGRGVLLLDAFASQWGVTPHPGDGKTVWFELSPSVSL